MRSPIPDYLTELSDHCSGATRGAVADYIPALAEADPDRFAVCIATVEGALYGAGDVDDEFSIQSISKPFTYGLALDDRGLEGVLEKVDVEPSGDAFNDISLEEDTGRPRNPMINAGAIATHALVKGRGPTERNRRILRLYSAAAGRDLSVDERVMKGEQRTAWRNRALALLMRNTGLLEGNPDQAVDGYVRQCSVNVTTRDLALMAATLANGGRQPVTKRQVISPRSVQQVLSVMLTCGMYDSAGDWFTTVGIPAKSGVSGGIIGVLPGKVGIAVFSPRLDEHGNSVAGVRMFERLSADMGMHMMQGRVEARAPMRDVDVVEKPDGDATVYELQGDLDFNSAEMGIRTVAESPPTTQRIVVDLSRVGAVDDVAKRMLLEAVRRLTLEDGHTAYLFDPGRRLGDPDHPASDGTLGWFDAGDGARAWRLAGPHPTLPAG